MTRKAKVSRDVFLFTTLCHLHRLTLTQPPEMIPLYREGNWGFGKPPGEASKVLVAWEAPKHVTEAGEWGWRRENAGSEGLQVPVAWASIM